MNKIKQVDSAKQKSLQSQNSIAKLKQLEIDVDHEEDQDEKESRFY